MCTPIRIKNSEWLSKILLRIIPSHQVIYENNQMLIFIVIYTTLQCVFTFIKQQQYKTD